MLGFFEVSRIFYAFLVAGLPYHLNYYLQMAEVTKTQLAHEVFQKLEKMHFQSYVQTWAALSIDQRAITKFDLAELPASLLKFILQYEWKSPDEIERLRRLNDADTNYDQSSQASSVVSEQQEELELVLSKKKARIA